MPLQNKKQQVLAEVESSEGTAATLTAASGVQVFDPQINTTSELQERAAASPSLSNDFAPVGRSQRTITFKTDFKGSGSTASAPPFGKFLQGGGWKQTPSTSMRLLTIAAVTGGPGFQVGEIVQQTASNRGVIVCILDSGNVPKHRTLTSGDKLVVAVLTGTLGTAATTGESSASVTTPSAAANAPLVFGYQHTSEKLVTLVVASWTGSPPVAGDVVKIENATTNELIGAVQVIRDNGAGMLNFEATFLWGQPGFNSTAAQNRLRSPANGTATLTTAPVQSRGQSLTIGHNLDGRNRPMLGSRGDFTLEGDAGTPLQFTWTFTGDPGTDVDALPVATTGLSTVSAPRLLGAYIHFGIGAESYRIPTKRVSYSNGGTLISNADANRAGGSTGGLLTERGPSFTFTVDNQNGAVDWETAQRNGTPVRVAVILGTVAGNIEYMVAPYCQVVECPLGNVENVSTFDVTLRARRVLEAGDDEVYIGQA